MSEDETPPPGRLLPKHLAPFFLLAAAFHVVALATRFDVLAEKLPPGTAAGIFIATFPLLFVEGYFEGRLWYGESTVDLPLWMRIKSKPVKLAFTFAFTYLAVVLLQTLDIGIGPIDPTPPEEWGVAQRAQWFAMMSAGMFFPNYLAATGALVPGLRALTSPLRKIPALLALPIAAALGLGAGYGAGYLLHSKAVATNLHAVQSTWDGFTEDPAIAIGVAFAGILVPMLVGAVLEKLKKEPAEPA